MRSRRALRLHVGRCTASPFPQDAAIVATLLAFPAMPRQLITLALFATLATSATASAQRPAASQKTLDIYIADTEGGKATLFVSPEGETVLIDTGNPGARDGDRVFAMLTAAGVKRIDHLISTHYH